MIRKWPFKYKILSSIIRVQLQPDNGGDFSKRSVELSLADVG